MILITGATGLLGFNLTQHLKSMGYSVITHGRSGGADLVSDLCDFKKCSEYISVINPSVIVNLVGLTNVDQCEANINLAYLSNARAVENLASWIQESKTSCHLVHISTDHVYDGIGLHTEDEVVLSNVYALSKYAGELAAMMVPSSILRTNFIGRSKTKNRSSFSDWLYSLLINSNKIQVLDDVYFSPLSMKTLVEMIQLVIEKKPVGIFNLGSNNGMSKAEFSFSFANCLNMPTWNMSRILARDAVFLNTYRPKDMRMDCSKFERELNVILPQFVDEIVKIAGEYDGVK